MSNLTGSLYLTDLDPGRNGILTYQNTSPWPWSIRLGDITVNLTTAQWEDLCAKIDQAREEEKTMQAVARDAEWMRTHDDLGRIIEKEKAA